MRVALAQINSTLGNFSGNQNKILNFIQRAVERRCELVVFPEAALFGYHPFDLLERGEVVEQQMKALAQIEKKIPAGVTAVIGVITKNPSKKGRPYFNSVAVVERKKKTRFFHKQLLPTGDVFDEARFVEPGHTKDNTLKIRDKKVQITICEDIWAWPEQDGSSPYPVNPLTAIKAKVDLVINVSASPYFPGRIKRRKELAALTARHFRAPMIYVNMVGAQDEIIFDGASFAIDKHGKSLLECIKFGEDLNVLDLNTLEGGTRPQKLSVTEEIHQALVLGIRDFCDKTGLKKVHLGLSGGIDSAVVAALAVDALGPSRVTTVAMPGPFSSEVSLTLAEKLAKNLGVRLLQMPISQAYTEIKTEIEASLGTREFSVLHENLQARLRGLFLMSLANAENSLLLSTSNKSEFATGYSTLYGDMCGGLAVIGDLTKKQTYELAKLYNQTAELIPEEIISRAPSAELRPNQKDQDTLPSYDLLDKSVEKIVENCGRAGTVTDKWLLPILMRTEFKRWQAAPILKVSRHSFGRGRRYPIAHQAKL